MNNPEFRLIVKTFRFGLFFLVTYLLSTNLYGQTSFIKEWEKSFGSLEGDDFLWDVKPTSDGGFILGGTSNSGAEGGKSQAARYLYRDIWMIKLDAKGNKEWDKTIGGNKGDGIRVLHQTADGGFILGGESWSDPGGHKTEPCRGGKDWWLVKLDAKGNKLWDKTYGGDSNEILRKLIITSDGGYILAGESYSGVSGDKTQGTLLPDGKYSSYDYWILKLDANGKKLWDTVIKRNYNDEIRYLKQTADKGFILGGKFCPVITKSNGQDSSGASNFWIIKLDAKGNTEWNRNFGEEKAYDFPFAMLQTEDSGFLLGGQSKIVIKGDSLAMGRYKIEGWLLKLDAKGNKLWEKKINTGLVDKIWEVQQTPANGYIVAGYSSRYDKEAKAISDSVNPSLVKQTWVMKLDAKGDKIWESKLDSILDYIGYINQMPDKGYLVTGGFTKIIEPETLEDFMERQKWIQETWVIKLNATGKNIWSTRISRKEHHTTDHLVLSKDGGFILWGQEFPVFNKADYWIVKFGVKK